MTRLEGSGMQITLENYKSYESSGFVYDDYVLTENSIVEEPEEIFIASTVPYITSTEPQLPKIPTNQVEAYTPPNPEREPEFETEEYEEEDEDSCSPTPLSLFIPADAVNTNIFGSQPYSQANCSSCEAGVQPNFQSINGDFSTIQPFQTTDPPIGSFYCPGGNICIEEENGALWTTLPDSPAITLIPVPKCENGRCGVYMLFVAGRSHSGNPTMPDLVSLADQRAFRAEHMQFDGGFRNLSTFPYIRIVGFSCRPCAQEIPYCIGAQ
ncbi:unnamed protein product, partial [Mesorhabditis spiculigera]